MKITYSIIALLFSVMTYAQVAETAEEVCPLLIGEKVPDIEIVSAENRTANLNQIAGTQPTVLLF